MFGRFFLLAMMLMAFGTPMMAADGAPVFSKPIAMALAAGLCALGQGKAVAGIAEGIARNPGAGTVIRGIGLLGLAFIESLALFTLVVVFATPD